VSSIAPTLFGLIREAGRRVAEVGVAGGGDWEFALLFAVIAVIQLAAVAAFLAGRARGGGGGR
jgi:hypothetical protein